MKKIREKYTTIRKNVRKSLREFLGRHPRIARIYLWGHRVRQRLILWWRRNDHRYGIWWRVANVAVTVVVVFSVAIPVLSQIMAAKAYALSAESRRLVGSVDTRLSGQLTYDAQQSTYRFNKAALKGDSANPVAALQAQVGSAGGAKNDKSLYSLDVPTQFAKGVTYTDVNSGLSFSLKPQFGAMDGKQIDGHLVFPLGGGTQAIYTLKGNGLKEDIVVPEVTRDTLSFSYTIVLPKTLEMKMIPNGGGAVGVYAADPSLYGSMSYGSDGDRAAVEKARETADKNYLVFGLPAPVVKDLNGETVGTSKFILDGDTLTVQASGLSGIKGPITIDPSVVVTSTSDFQTGGNSEGMIDFGTAGQITRGGLTGGSAAGGWTATTSFTTARTSHTSVVYNGYLYVIGGSGGSSLNDVQYAPINANGTIGTWTATTSFTTARQGHTSVAYNGYLYVIGGFNGSYLNDTQYAPINANGTIGTWTATTSFTTARQAHTSVIYNGYLYVIGGTNGSNLSDVQYAPINANGTIGTWGSTTALTTARNSHTSVAYNGYLYVIGGSGGSNLNDVQYAPINADGTVGTWASTASFTTGRYSHTVVTYNGYLYLIGGYNGSYLNDTQYAPINANGTIGTWVTTSSVTTARKGHTSVAYNGYLYTIGGSSGSNLSDVQYAKIDPAGQPKSFGTLTNSFTTARALVCSVALNGYLYAIGGSTTDNGSNNVTTVQYTALNSSTGNNGTWSSTTVLPAATGSAGCTTYNGIVYVVGGYTAAGTATATVYYSTQSGTGTLGAWTTAANSVPANVGNKPGVFTYATSGGTNLYALGGCDVAGTAACGKVYYSTLNSRGVPGTWTTNTNAMVNNYTSRGYALVGNYLYAIGGSNATNTAYTSVEYAPINANGTVGTWTATTALGTAIGYGLVTTVNGCIYLMGGETGAGVSLANVQYACPAANGTISAWNNAPNLTVATTDMGITSYNGYVYGVGGWTSAAVATTQFAQVNNGGSGAGGTWTSTTALAAGRAFQATTVSNGYIYVAGGVGSPGEYNDVQYAPINADGTIGSWNATTSFATGVDGLEAVAYNNYLYLLGGSDATTSYATVQYAPINANGTIGSWTATTSFTNARSNFKSVAYGGYLYVIGGHNSSSVNYNDVQYAPINANGTIGSWASTNTFTGARYGLKAVAYGGYLYVVGGYDGTTYYNDVQFAPINTNGTVGTWASTTSFPSARYSHTVVAANGFLYVIGGRNGATYYNDVQYAPIYANGTIGPWSTSSSFTNARYGHTSVVYNGTVYVIGGSPDAAVTLYSDVQYAPLTSIARTAHYSKLIDLGISANVTSVTTHDASGNTSPSTMTMTYRAAGVNGTFGSSSPISAISGSGPCTGTTTATRYLLINVTLDDSLGLGTSGGFADANTTPANLADFTVNYTPTHPAPSTRLRGGQTLQTGTLSPLDICGVGA